MEWQISLHWNQWMACDRNCTTKIRFLRSMVRLTHCYIILKNSKNAVTCCLSVAVRRRPAKEYETYLLQSSYFRTYYTILTELCMISWDSSTSTNNQVLNLLSLWVLQFVVSDARLWLGNMKNKVLNYKARSFSVVIELSTQLCGGHQYTWLSEI